MTKKLDLGITPPSDEEMAKVEARIQAEQQADERRDARERVRRADLERRRPAIERALKAYRKIDDPDVTEVRIRTGFIRTDDPRRTAPLTKGYSLAAEVESRPPMTRLVERRRHSLQLMMTMIFVARLEASPGQRFVNQHPNITPRGIQESWLTLAGLKHPVSPTERRGQRRMFNTAIDGLLTHDLVALTGTAGQAGRYRGFALQAEDGSRTPYTVPGEGLRRKDAIALSADFFRQGWHLVLTDHELVTFLAIIDRTGYLRRVERSGLIHDMGVDLKEAVRYATYGLSGEAYNSIHMLDRFGLITVIDPMLNRRNPTPAKFKTIPLSSGDDVSAEDDDDEKADSNNRIPYRLIYPPVGGEILTAALDTALDKLAI
ncbi:hypothetical protein [Prescottella equi]|uniref:hypothetical protein n=1 Tax=Rhodococcus hoagii TaxID=43767 RepID=UPI001C78C7DF|nr:hypothetical protein [Prescottella equi]BCN51597.1 hypothetical protein RE9416_48980 [Prescottella equi]BCN56618.1 hypothetical protein RE9425_50080 [Prescottella equi]BCN61532.1 hypothetical protein RE9427_49020 [Prescottella equi]BCN86335.1 hypothetical protein RE0356_49760 [Prescottella equi]